ncbi:MAG: DUF6122 family protein [Xanthomonadales bacterium]|nr:DUF6122 family protein [Xanthomonadales bacterium]
MIHLALHVLLPLAVAAAFFRNRWRSAFVWMMAGMLIDLDHLLATPIYDPLRCSVGFHPLHQWPAIILYLVLLAFPKTRLLGIGLVIHIALDSMDCRINTGVWMTG